MPTRLANMVTLLCPLLVIAMLGTGAGDVTRDGMWMRDTVMDDLRSSADVLWVQEACTSDAACVVMCLSSVVCKSVFYNPIKHQCHGHSEIVTVSGTTAEVGNIFFSKIIQPAPPTTTTASTTTTTTTTQTTTTTAQTTTTTTTTPTATTSTAQTTTTTTTPTATTTTTPTPYIHQVDSVNNMVYDIYTSGPMGWLGAEAECLRRSMRLIRLDTSAKRTALRTMLGTLTATRNEQIWVAGYRCCYFETPTWDSAKLYPCPSDIYNHSPAPLPVPFVTSVNSSDTIDLLTWHILIDDARLFVCEDTT